MTSRTSFTTESRANQPGFVVFLATVSPTLSRYRTGNPTRLFQQQNPRTGTPSTIGMAEYVKREKAARRSAEKEKLPGESPIFDS